MSRHKTYTLPYSAHFQSDLPKSLPISVMWYLITDIICLISFSQSHSQLDKSSPYKLYLFRRLPFKMLWVRPHLKHHISRLAFRASFQLDEVCLNNYWSSRNLVGLRGLLARCWNNTGFVWSSTSSRGYYF